MAVRKRFSWKLLLIALPLLAVLGLGGIALREHLNRPQYDYEPIEGRTALDDWQAPWTGTVPEIPSETSKPKLGTASSGDSPSTGALADEIAKKSGADSTNVSPVGEMTHDDFTTLLVESPPPRNTRRWRHKKHFQSLVQHGRYNFNSPMQAWSPEAVEADIRRSSIRDSMKNILDNVGQPSLD